MLISKNIVIMDFTIFMGMHSDNERTRVMCKNFIVENADSALYIPLDHVGMCDHVVWQHPYSVQALYYPFMDVLHSTYKIIRFSYSVDIFSRVAVKQGRDDGVALSYTLLCSAAQRAQANLFSLANTDRKEYTQLPCVEEPLAESKFDDELESLYQQSQALVVPEGMLRGREQWKELFHHL